MKHIIFSIVLLIIYNIWEINSVGEYFYPNDENCGLRDIIPGDARTENPWVVTIHNRRNSKSPFRYFITGGLISPTAVISILGGGYGQPPYKNTNKKYYIPPSSNFLVTAGLSSTDIKDADEHTQFSNVTYALPFKANSTGNEEYHMVIFRLATPMNLTTPYVRSTCQPYAALPSFAKMGLTGRFSDILQYNKNIEPSYASGFDTPLNTPGLYNLTSLISQTSNDRLCLNTYKYYYRSEPDEIFCLIVLPVEGVSNTTCLTHGTLKVFYPSRRFLSIHTYFSPIQRMYLSGAISLIPRKERGQCDINTVYYVVNVWSGLDWIKANVICGPETYPCSNGKCIPLNQVCDGKPDCSTGDLIEDEDPVFCSATNRCKATNSYQCGLEGICIRSDQVGDAVKDCPSGSDEDPKVLLNRKEAMSASVDSTDICDPILPAMGVVATCSHPKFGNVDCSKAPPGTKVNLSCGKNYVPLSKTNFITMKCYGDKSWRPSRSFSCRPECGLLSLEVQPYIVHGKEVISGTPFPWHAAILRQNNDGSIAYICGASLIEQNILVTAGHCTTNEEGVPYDFKTIKVAFSYDADIGNVLRQKNGKIEELFEVEETRRPKSYNAKTLESDIAIVKLVESVTYSETVKPICYLLKNYRTAPPVNFTGIVAGYGVTETGLPSTKLRYANLEILPKDKCNLKSRDKFCAKSPETGESLCHGDSGGGFVFPIDIQADFVSYLLKGVVSSHENIKKDECDPDSSSVSGFTHLDAHSEWLLTVLQNITTVQE